MPTRRPTVTPESELSSLIRVLALGFAHPALTDRDLDAISTRELWALEDRVLADTYQQHRTAVDSEARRLGLRRAWIADHLGAGGDVNEC